MPYLSQIKKERLALIVKLMHELVVSPGEVNYLCCEAALAYLNRQGINYDVISGAVAAVGDAHDELKERVLKIYERYKIKANGDIFNDICKRIDIIMKGGE